MATSYKSNYRGEDIDLAVGAVINAKSNLQNKLQAGNNITLTEQENVTIISSLGGDVTIDDQSIVKNSSGEIQMKQEYIDYLDNILYKAPEILTFRVVSSDGASIPQTNELGTSLIIPKLIHRESNTSNISGVSSKTIYVYVNDSSTSVLGVQASEVDKTEAFTSPLTITSTTKYSLRGIDVKNNTFSKDYLIGFYRYAYTNTTSSANTPTTGTKQSVISTFASNGNTFNYNAGDYIYFYTTGTGKKVQTNVLGQWADVDTEELGTVTFTQANNATFSYNVYRIGPFIASGSAKYRI